MALSVCVFLLPVAIIRDNPLDRDRRVTLVAILQLVRVTYRRLSFAHFLPGLRKVLTFYSPTPIMLSPFLDPAPLNFLSTFRKMEEEEITSDLPPGALSIDALEALYADNPGYLADFKIMSVIKFVAAFISFVSSVTLIWMIRRSYIGLSTTQHRILVAFSMADIFNAMGHLFANVSTPSGMSYMVWGAHGNDFSCNVNGFFTTLGFTVAPLYNCSLVSSEVVLTW